MYMLRVQVCRGLFQAHRLIFSFLICTSIQQQAQAITAAEWTFLLRATQPVPVTRLNPAPSVFTPAMWGGLATLEEVLPVFKGVLRSVTLETQAWIKWLQSATPNVQPLPASWQAEVCGRTAHVLQTACVCRGCHTSGHCHSF